MATSVARAQVAWCHCQKYHKKQPCQLVAEWISFGQMLVFSPMTLLKLIELK